MKPQTLFVNTILVAAVATAVLASLGGTDLGGLENVSSKRDSVKKTSPKPRSPKHGPPQIANPLPTRGAEGKAGSSRSTETTQEPTGNGLEDSGNSGLSDAPGEKPRTPSKPSGQGKVSDIRKQVSENLKKTLGQKSRAQGGSLSVETYNRKADSLRQTQQENLEDVIEGS